MDMTYLLSTKSSAEFISKISVETYTQPKKLLYFQCIFEVNSAKLELLKNTSSI
jgi:hypothetical protein